MTTAAVVFLTVHALLHLAIWLPHPVVDPAKPPPFEPGHSAVLTAVEVPPASARGIAVGLTWATTAAYLVAAFTVAADSDLVAVALACAGLLGVALKTVFFHPWLSVGLLLDVLVIASALTGWPLTPT